MAIEPPHLESPNLALRGIFVQQGQLRPAWRLVAYGILLAMGIATMSVQLLLLALAQIVLGIRLPEWFHEAYLSTAYLGIVVLVTWLARRRLDRRPLRDLGLQNPPVWRREILLGLALGAVLMLAVFTVEVAAGWVHITGFAWQDYDVLTVAAFIVLEGWSLATAAVGEELIIRGYVLQTLELSVGLPAAVFISSVIFALLHATNPSASVLATINLVVAGAMLAIAYVLTRRLWLPIALHFSWNFFQGAIFGFPISGWQEFRLLQQTNTGPTLLAGGAFGPEGGVLGLLAMVGGILVLRAWGRRRVGESGSPESGVRSPESEVRGPESGVGSPESEARSREPGAGK
jgi:hypothetical protein